VNNENKTMGLGCAGGHY